VALSLLIPTVAGYVVHGFTLDGALRGFIWGAWTVVRITPARQLEKTIAQASAD
jgi:hypothetical protein